jgi:putative transposase
MRIPRIKADGHGFYHCISRTCEGRHLFATTSALCVEAEVFIDLMHRLACFCGIRILTYVVMSNHFHILCEVPERRPVSDDELLERIECLYGAARRRRIALELETCVGRSNSEVHRKEIHAPFVSRMFDVSIFLKELKGNFAQWYNKRHNRFGVFWAERFKSVLVEDGNALRAIAAYIDLNPVRGGLCRDPKDYRFCGYAEALARASAPTRSGICTALAYSFRLPWKEVAEQYRCLLFSAGLRTTARPNRDGFDEQTVRRVVQEEKGKLTMPTLLSCRVRYFTRSGILGSRCFVETYVARLKDALGYRRDRKAHQLPEFPEFWALQRPRPN